DHVGGSEELLALFVEQQVIVAEMWAAHVPVEVLRLDVEREGVGQDAVQGGGNVLGGVGAEIGRRLQTRCFVLGGIHGSRAPGLVTPAIPAPLWPHGRMM